MDVNSDDGLYAVFFEALKDGKRNQWVLFPPARTSGRLAERTAGFSLGAGVHDGTTRFIKRRMDKPGDKARWKTIERGPRSANGTAGDKLFLELEQYVSMGWNLVTPIVVKLEWDDYFGKVWQNNAEVATPYKTLRHIEAALKKRDGRRLID